MNNIFTNTHLLAGIRKFKENQNWDKDFHNGLYRKLRLWRANGLDQNWWRKIIDVLWNWRAIRPNSKSEIFENGKVHLNELQAEYLTILEVMGNEEPLMADLSWETLSGLFTVAAEIKYTMPFSPVFPSKLCHFIFPNAYPVMDRKMIGISTRYSQHWDFCKDQWINCTGKQELVSILRNEVKDNVFEYYPWSTKITELCLSGKNYLSEREPQ